VNGHGAYFSATDPNSLSASISAALAGVAAAGGAAAAPSISNPSLSAGDNYVFSSTYTTSDWTGELVRRQLDPNTGAVSTTNDWSAQEKLDANTSRNIYTFDASVPSTRLKAFTSANFAASASFLSPHIATAPTGLTQFLCASTDICLSSTDQDTAHAAGANLVNFLRGDRSNEGAEKDNTKYYRQRQHILGDLVNAQVVYVTKPRANYADAGYSDFAAAQSARQAVVYAGANDGMLHAFQARQTAATEAAVAAAAAATAAAAADPSDSALATAAVAATVAANAAVAADNSMGQELWAYIPSMVLPNLFILADKKYKDRHRYFVDATPVVADICASNCTSTTGAVWKTILVGGLGRGGRGYYALDITDPANPKALWEFTDTNLGYSYGNPQVAKLKDGTWVVLVTSGYNNIANEDGAGGDGVGHLYVINASSGALLKTVNTKGNASDPSGLAQITAQVVNPESDNTVEVVYGGDLYGNLWRFDINKTIGEAQLLAVLKDGVGDGNPQPITTKPEVGLVPAHHTKVVFVGTGSFLAASDASDTRQQSIYAIKDPVVASTTATEAEALATAIYDNPGGSPRTTGTSTQGFVRQIISEIDCPVGTLPGICAQGSKVRTSTNNTVDFSAANGWFVDLIGTAERANTDPALGLGLLAVNTNAPTLAACDIGGTSYRYFFNYQTGGPIYTPGNTGVVGKLLANALASSPTLVVTRDGSMKEVSGLSGGGSATSSATPPVGTELCPGGICISDLPQPPQALISRRTSWRELIRE
jgi:type IV pilus assembly protein PilY1